MENLFDYLFHYNPYANLWNAIPRDRYLEYWSDTARSKKYGVLSSKDINTLIDMISRGDKFIKSIK
jgi:hypothetical protein